MKAEWPAVLCVRRTESLLLSVKPEAQAGQGQDPPSAPRGSIAGNLSPSHTAPPGGQVRGTHGPSEGVC